MLAAFRKVVFSERRQIAFSWGYSGFQPQSALFPQPFGWSIAWPRPFYLLSHGLAARHFSSQLLFMVLCLENRRVGTAPKPGMLPYTGITRSGGHHEVYGH